jgi:hypothetical protein
MLELAKNIPNLNPSKEGNLTSVFQSVLSIKNCCIIKLTNWRFTGLRKIALKKSLNAA